MSEWIEVFDYNYIYRDGYFVYDLIGKRIVNTEKIMSLHPLEEDDNVEIYKDGKKLNLEWFCKIFLYDGSSVIITQHEFKEVTEDCIFISEMFMDEEVIKC